MHIIVLTGAPGAGKSEVARLLLEHCPQPSAWIDTDKLAAVEPWRIDAAFHQLLGANLRACIENYARYGARVLVISGVVVPGGIYEELQPLVTQPDHTWSFYALQARRDVLTRRILQDAKPQQASQRLEWLSLNERATEISGCERVDTSDLELWEVAREVAQRAGLLHKSEGAVQVRAAELELPFDDVQDVCLRALSRCGTPAPIARKVVSALLDNELRGYSSHGLLRIPEYLAAIHSGTLMAAAEPAVELCARNTAKVNGRRGFGMLAADTVQETLSALLASEPIALVGLENSNHIGRLASVGEPLARCGYIALGFVNYLGAGQKVMPFGGAAPRLATNPLLFAFPRPSGEPIVLDLTTSVVAEGRVRACSLAGKRVPDGWLIDEHGRSVHDPERLYTQPPTAFLAPLGGGSAGHKGFALGLAVEILAGILTGAGFSCPQPEAGGNGGTFVGLRLTALGQEHARVLANIESLANYCLSAPAARGLSGVRLPGRPCPPRESGRVKLLSRVWRDLTELAGSARPCA